MTTGKQGTRPKASQTSKRSTQAITVNDIAKAAGVSRATVSLVLRESPLVHVDTRARVEAELKKQGYIYNRSAANLRRRTSSSIALVINDLTNPFFAEFAAGVDEAVGARGYVTLLGNTSESPEREEAVLASLMEHQPAGVILSPAEHSDGERLERVLGQRSPVVVFNRELTGAHWDFLVLDNRNGARMATEHLLELGHRRIAFFGGHADSSSCRERRAGYADAMRAAKIEPLPHWFVETAPTRLAAATRADALFLDGNAANVSPQDAPTAAVCYNDAVALGLMLGLVRHGRKPGEDFAVTGFDDIPEAAFAAPPLTTLAVDPRERGRQAAELLLQRIGTKEGEERQTTAPVRLVVRGSSCKPKGAAS